MSMLKDAAFLVLISLMILSATYLVSAQTQSQPATCTSHFPYSPCYGGALHWGYLPCMSNQTCLVYWMTLDSGARYHLLFNPSYSAPNVTLGLRDGMIMEANGKLTIPSTTSGFDGDLTVNYSDFVGICGNGQNGTIECPGPETSGTTTTTITSTCQCPIGYIQNMQNTNECFLPCRYSNPPCEAVADYVCTTTATIQCCPLGDPICPTGSNGEVLPTCPAPIIFKPPCPYDCCNADDQNYLWKSCPVPQGPACVGGNCPLCLSPVCQNHQCASPSCSYTNNSNTGWNSFSVPVKNVLIALAVIVAAIFVVAAIAIYLKKK
jgi:hypothetical protein